MSDDLDNVIDLDSRRRDDTSSAAAIAHTVVCLGIQRELYELKITSLKQTNRALVLVAVTAYILGMYCGFIVALERAGGL
jgi:hypothetical protein